MADKQQVVLELKNVTQTFQVRPSLFSKKLPLTAVKECSFKLHANEIVGLVGESGCGKSTMAKILLGIIKPTQGQVFIDGHELSSLNPQELAKIVQPIFQDPYSSLNPRKRISQIIGMPLSLTGEFDNAAIRRKVLDMLDLVGLPKRVENAYPSQMSGGQRQRVAIARALISRPRIVICDEPTSALDVSVQAQILNLLTDLRKELNLTYLLISHNLAVVEHLADRMFVMYLGRIVESGSAKQVFGKPQHPYTSELLNASLPPVPGHGIPKLHLGSEYPNPIKPPPGCVFHPRCGKRFAPCDSQDPQLIAVGGKAEHQCACLLYQ